MDSLEHMHALLRILQKETEYEETFSSKLYNRTSRKMQMYTYTPLFWSQ